MEIHAHRFLGKVNTAQGSFFIMSLHVDAVIDGFIRSAVEYTCKCSMSRITDKYFWMPTQICMFYMYDICCPRLAMSSRQTLFNLDKPNFHCTTDLYAKYRIWIKINIGLYSIKLKG